MKRAGAVALLSLVLVACGGESEPNDRESAAPKSNSPEAREMAAVDACHDVIRDQSKSPSMVEFLTTEADGYEYVSVEGEVDSQNPMGATVRAGYLCGVPMNADGTVNVTEIISEVRPR